MSKPERLECGDDTNVTVLKRNRTVSSWFPWIYVAIGIVLLIVLIGLMFIVVAGLMMLMIKKNNAQPKEIIYYDKNENVFVAYDYKGRGYKLTKEELLSKVTIRQGVKDYTGVVYNNKIQLGWIYREDAKTLHEFAESLG